MAIQAEQVRRNRLARTAGAVDPVHRDRVTGHLIDARGETPGRLCVLGAGNSADLDLPRLLAAFAEVHLIDLDREALVAGLDGQSPSARERVRLHGPHDLTGVVEYLERWSPTASPAPTELEACLAAAAAVPAPAGGPFDAVASTCLLTQLIEAVAAAIGEGHPRFLELVTAIRMRHLRMLIDLTRPGGAALLITDVVSSDTCAELPGVRLAELPAVIGRLVRAGNFFTGANPAVLERLLRTDPGLAPLLSAVEQLDPWLWRLMSRTYAVCAFKARRAIDAEQVPPAKR